MTFLGKGDLAGARAVLKAAPKEVEPALVAYLAEYYDLAWVLDESQRDLLLRLPPSAFDDDQGVWALRLAQAYALKGDAAKVRTHAEEAKKAFEEQLRATPDDARRHGDLGLALAYLGRKEEAIMESAVLHSIQFRRMRCKDPNISTSSRGSTYLSTSRRRHSTCSSRS